MHGICAIHGATAAGTQCCSCCYDTLVGDVAEQFVDEVTARPRRWTRLRRQREAQEDIDQQRLDLARAARSPTR